MNFFIPWVYQWYYEISTVPEITITAILKKHKIKWWTSFKNSTTEWIVKRNHDSYRTRLINDQIMPFASQKAKPWPN